MHPQEVHWTLWVCDHTQTDTLFQILEEVSETVKCKICLNVYTLPYRCVRRSRDAIHILKLIYCCSLECRHAWCGPCLVEWFASRDTTTCPECHVESIEQPQRDLSALDGVLSLVYKAQGRDVPTVLSANFDPSRLFSIYAKKKERKQYEDEYE